MKAKRFISVFLTMMMAVSSAVTVKAEDENLPIGYWNIAYPYRYVIFATDGGEYIKALEKGIGEVVNLDEYVPEKEGYIFDGWYIDPRTKVERVNEVKLNYNVVVYAKWVDDGTPKPIAEEEHIRLTPAQVLAYGQHIDERTGVPVTALWVQQNERLNALMEIHNQIFKN